MARGQHFRRHRLTYLGGPAAGATMFVTGILLGSGVGAAPLGEAVSLPPRAEEVQIGTAVRVSVDNPAPHEPPGRPVARVLSPCTAKRAQLKAVEDEFRSVYRTPTALELAEDAGVIARAVALECGWVDR